MGNIIKKTIVIAITVFVLGLTANGVSVAYSDTSNHWAKTAIDKWSDLGIINGYWDNSFKPNSNITRAEFAALMNRIFNAQVKSSNSFSDIKASKWYADEMAKAVAMKSFVGDGNGTIRPEENITRQEVAVIIVRLFDIKTNDTSSTINRFEDFSMISPWASDAMAAMVVNKYLNGYTDNTLRPDKNITRAEAVRIIDNLVAKLIKVEGTYTDHIFGNIVINIQNVNLKNSVINGNVYLADGISDGNVKMENVDVIGDIIVRGGGVNSVTFDNVIVNNINLLKPINISFINSITHFIADNNVPNFTNSYSLGGNSSSGNSSSGSNSNGNGGSGNSTTTTNDNQEQSVITSYVCYYEGYDAKLKNFDAAIIESNGMTNQEIAELNNAGVSTIAYLSIGEDYYLNKGNGNGPGGMASYYIDDGKGTPRKNPNWNSYYVNAGDSTWQDAVISQARTILNKGCNGLFLDTIDTTQLFPETTDGMVSLVRLLRETFPDCKLIANRGFNIVDRLAPYIDGVMFEDFSSTYDFDKGGYRALTEAEFADNLYVVTNILNTLCLNNNLIVFTLDYCEADNSPKIKEYYDRSKAFGYIPYCSNIDLDKIYIIE